MAYCFSLVCLLHSVTAVVSGCLMMFFWREVSIFGHGKETASKLLGSTPHDQLLIQTSDSLAGMLLFSVGIMLFMVSFVRDREFQSFFAKGCIVLHTLMALWRFYFARRVEDLARDWPRQVVGDIIMSLSGLLEHKGIGHVHTIGRETEISCAPIASDSGCGSVERPVRMIAGFFR